MSDTILGAIIGVVSAAIGALLAWWRESRIHRHQERKGAENFRQAIRAEVNAFWEAYMSSIGGQMDTHDPNAAFLSFYPIEQPYFTIFDTSASMLGGLPSQAEREAIITFYVNAKSLMDRYTLNNVTIRELNNISAKDDPFCLKAGGTISQLEGCSSTLKERHDQLKVLKGQLLDMLATPMKN